MWVSINPHKRMAYLTGKTPVMHLDSKYQSS